MKLIKSLAKRVIVTLATAVMTLPGMAVGSALADSVSVGDQWMKFCQKDEKAKKDACSTAFDLRTEDGQYLASFMVMEMTGEARRFGRLIIPTGLLLQPGLKVQVDQNKPEDAKFTVCAQDACQAEMLISDAFIAALKKGKLLSIGAQGQQANPVNFSFPLDTFKSVNEGKPLDEAEMRKRAEAVQAEINAKHKSLEDQLKDAQHKAQESE